MSQASSPSDVHCPSCGRFVGAQETCPNCGAHLGRRISLRLIQYGAVILAVLGLVALWFAARARDIPVVRIQDISSTMNWAYVKLQGTVIRPPSFDAQTGYLRFWIFDGSGEMMVAAYRNESQALLTAGKVPAMGDEVTVEGTLKVKEDFQSLTLNVPDHFIVVRPQPVEMAIAGVTLEQLYQKVLVRGQVRQVKRPYEGLTILTVRDAGGEIDVTYTADLVRLTGQPAEVQPGDSVSVRGAVSLYGETSQLALDAADGLQKLPQEIDIAPLKTIREIRPTDVGQMTRIEGAITAVKWMSAGQRLTLDDGTGDMTVILWQDIIDGILDRVDLQVGTWLSVRGLVSEYKGELELLPELPLDVRITQARPVEVARLSLAGVSEQVKGQTIQVEGQIVRVSPFSSGQKITLQDGDARLILVFWQDLFAACPDQAELTPGAWVSAVGKVEVYRDELELIPGHAQDVVFLKRTALPQAQLRRIETIDQDDLGQTVIIEGQISAVQTFAQGVRWTVDDGSGSLIVLVWNNVLAPLSVTFEVGVRVQVQGEIEIYQGQLEIIPAAAADICWMQAAALPPTPTFTVAPTATPAATAAITPTLTPTPVLPTATARPPTATPGVQVVATGKLSQSLIGQTVTIQGQIVEVISFASGVKFYVDDGSGRAALWMVQAVYASLSNPGQWIVGSMVRAKGLVEEYKGELEVSPQKAGDVTVLAAATPPPVTLARMADLSAADKGKTVTVEGQIVEVRPFSQGMKYTLDDGSGKITLLLWQNIYDAVPDKDRLAVGVQVRVTGKVDEYRGEMEVIPEQGSNVLIKP